MSFFIDGNLIGSLRVNRRGVASLKYTTNNLSIGTHRARAVYANQQGNFIGSTSNTVPSMAPAFARRWKDSWRCSRKS